jgi:hypothetical protein
MRRALSLLIAALGAPLVCGGLFVVIFVTLVGLAIPQLPSWARPGVQAWMLGTPQPVGDYYGNSDDGPDGVFTGGQVGFEGYVGLESFVCRIPPKEGSKRTITARRGIHIPDTAGSITPRVTSTTCR